MDKLEEDTSLGIPTVPYMFPYRVAIRSDPRGYRCIFTNVLFGSAQLWHVVNKVSHRTRQDIMKAAQIVSWMSVRVTVETRVFCDGWQCLSRYAVLGEAVVGGRSEAYTDRTASIYTPSKDVSNSDLCTISAEP